MNRQTENTPLNDGIVIYQGADKTVQIDIKLERQTLWLNLNKISSLFRRDKSVISRHLHKIFKSKELERNSVVAYFATTAADGKIYNVEFYNLDAIISVGYRVNSIRGTQFRIWATDVLRKHLIDGYTLNEKRLTEQSRKFRDLQNAIKLIKDVTHRKQIDHAEALSLLDVVSDYSYALEILDGYDHGSLKIAGTSKTEHFRLSYDGALNVVEQLRKRFGLSVLFGREKDKSFRSSIATIYQTFDRKELYPSVEEKAANLLYFIVKNHSFVDGNKRIAASIFLYFLERNRILYRKDRTKRIADNALVAITLLIAASNPTERDVITKLIVSLINVNN